MKNLLSVVLLLLSCSVCSAKGDKTNDPMEVFGDKMGTSLARRVKAKDIIKIQDAELRELAIALYNKTYSTDYRVAKYNAVLNPNELGRQLHIGNGYSNYEGMTGIYLEAGEQTILVDNIAEGKEIKLLVPNWNRRAPEGMDPTKDPKGWGLHKDVYKIANGVNKIEIKKSGLAYISYYSDKPETENEITVHFLNDKVNGYFDITKNDNNDWDSLLKNAVYPIMDAKGRYVQIAYPVIDLQKHAAGRGVDLMSNYDSLVKRQHRFIGLEKYNKIPKNRILARVNFNYYMFRDGDGVAYMGAPQGYAMGMVANPDVVISGDPCWGFSHEVGHVHQLRPYLNWGGLGEVSNNIISMYVTKSFGVKSRLSAGKSYAKARESIIDKKISYLQSGDVMCRLVPFWQLQLYFAQNGNKDFYPDLFEELRKNANTAGGGWGDRGKNEVTEHQLNFVKTVCKVAKVDLTDFFEKWGYFYVGEFVIGDYGTFNYKMTDEMVAKTKKEIKDMNLPQPKEDVTTYED